MVVLWLNSFFFQCACMHVCEYHTWKTIFQAQNVDFRTVYMHEVCVCAVVCYISSQQAAFALWLHYISLFHSLSQTIRSTWSTLPHSIPHSPIFNIFSILGVYLFQWALNLSVLNYCWVSSHCILYIIIRYVECFRHVLRLHNPQANERTHTHHTHTYTKTWTTQFRLISTTKHTLTHGRIQNTRQYNKIQCNTQYKWSLAKWMPKTEKHPQRCSMFIHFHSFRFILRLSLGALWKLNTQRIAINFLVVAHIFDGKSHAKRLSTEFLICMLRTCNYMICR